MNLAPRSTHILFVCLGNICRSPTAEGVFREALRRHAPQLAVQVDSAGTADYHTGCAPDPRAQRHARTRGIEIGELRARQVSARDFFEFELILAMDGDNLRALRQASPPGATAQLLLFMEYAPQAASLDIPDPYYGRSADFDRVLDLTQAASLGLIDCLQRGTYLPLKTHLQQGT